MTDFLHTSRLFILWIFIVLVNSLQAQITSGDVMAGFGVDGEIRANQLVFGSITQPASGTDDWFKHGQL